MNKEDALHKADEYAKNPAKVLRVLKGTNRSKKRPNARRLNKGNPSTSHVRDRFFGRLGKKAPDFHRLLCQELNYCGEESQLLQSSLEKLIVFLLAMSAPVYILLAELMFLLQRSAMGRYCRCKETQSA